MKLFGRPESGHVIDRRTHRAGWWIAGVGCVGGGALAFGFGGVQTVLCAVGVGEAGDCATVGVSEERRLELDAFVGVVLRDTERVWEAEFAARGQTYRPTTVILHDTPQASLCGVIAPGRGPAYCKFDEKIYLDVRFFSERAPAQGAQGDFPPAYIIAHEVAHHVQNLVGVFDQRYFGRLDDPEADADQLRVRLELQADCLAGVWAKRADEAIGMMEPGDLEEALRTAEVFGDDAPSAARNRGVVRERASSHGSGAQRARWLKIGFEGGDRDACDTWSPAFSAL